MKDPMKARWSQIQLNPMKTRWRPDEGGVKKGRMMRKCYNEPPMKDPMKARWRPGRTFFMNFRTQKLAKKNGFASFFVKLCQKLCESMFLSLAASCCEWLPPTSCICSYCRHVCQEILVPVVFHQWKGFLQACQDRVTSVRNTCLRVRMLLNSRKL